MEHGTAFTAGGNLGTIARVTRRVAFYGLLAEVVGPFAGFGILLAVTSVAPSFAEAENMAVYILFGVGLGCLPGALLLGVAWLAEGPIVEARPCRGLVLTVFQTLLTAVVAVGISLPFIAPAWWLLSDSS